MPVDYRNLNAYLRGYDELQGRYPAPGAPNFPDYQGLSPEEEQAILDAMRKYIQGNTNQNLRDVRQNAASRGFFRSGQLPAMEARTRRAGTEAYGNSLANYYTGKAGRLQNWNQSRANFNLSKWQTQQRGYNEGQRGLGSIYNRFFRPG